MRGFTLFSSHNYQAANQRVDRGRGQRAVSSHSLLMRPTATFQTRMATAVCGLQSTGANGKPAKIRREHRRKAKDSRRRQAALLFLNNISLDGRPQCQVNDGIADPKDAEEHRLEDRDASVLPPPAEGQEAVAQVTEPAAAGGGGSSSSLPGVVSPARPSLVMSPGLTSSTVGANEVFLEGGSTTETLTPDTPMSPVSGGHQLCSRVKSTPTALSPVPAGNTVDSRQR